MKKVITLVLVLSMVSMASAALQISVNGDPEPIDSEITIAPSDFLVLDIHGTTQAAETVYWMIVVEAAEGTVAGGTPMAGGLSSMFAQYMLDNYFLGYAGRPGASAVGGTIADLGALDGLLVDLIDFHCEGEGDAIVQLYTSADTVSWGVEDQVIIHQIPEPATMALLGIGGLLLRRKK